MEIYELLNGIGVGVATKAINDLISIMSKKKASRTEWEEALSSISEIDGKVNEVMKLLISSNIISEKENIVEVNGTHMAEGIGTIIGLDIHGSAVIKPGTVAKASGKGTVIGTRIGSK